MLLTELLDLIIKIMENNQYNSGDHYEDHVYSNY